MDQPTKSPNKPGKYISSHIENYPDTLTIIKDPKLIYSNLYNQATYIWIIDDIKKLEYKPRQIEEKASVKINFVDDVKKIQQQYEDNQRIILICQISILRDIEKILEPIFLTRRILTVIFYTTENKNEEINIKLKYSYINPSLFHSQQQIINEIKDHKNYYSTGDFVNFIQLENKVQDSNILVKTMFVMIKQNTNMQKIMQHFKQLALLCYNQYQPDIQQLVNNYSKGGHIQGNQAVWWYARQTFLFRFVNRLLRISKDPTCLFILQPYFKDLFNNVKKLYREQQEKGFYNQKSKKKNYKKFICFRGAQISKNQILFFQNNVNSYIQNLGFFSSSRTEDAAIQFAKNAMFEIQVDEDQRKPQIDYGFADINEFNPQNQDQILFNPLNSFKIVDFVQQNENFYRVKLIYGEMARLVARESNSLTDKQLSIKNLGEHQMRESESCNNISYILLEDNINLQSGQQFCNKFFEIAINSKNQEIISYGLTFKSSIAKNKGDYKTMNLQSIKNLQIIEKFLKKKSRICHNGKNQLYFFNWKQRVRDCVAQSYLKLGQYQKASEIYQTIQKLTKQKFGQNDLKYVKALQNLVTCYFYLSRSKEALEFLEKCEKIQRKILGQNHPDYARTLYDLGLNLNKLGKYQKAEKYLKKSEKIIRQTLGEKNLAYTNTLDNLASSYLQTKRYKLAVECLEKQEKIQREIIGQNHPDYATTLNNLAHCFNKLKKYDKAIENLIKCEKIQRETLGENHPEYAITLSNLADYFNNLGQYQQGLKYLLKCEIIHRQKLGERTADHARTLNNLGYTYDSLNEYDKAGECYLKSLNIRKQIYGEYHPEYTTTLNNLGYYYCNLKKYESALFYYEKCEQIHRQISEESYPEYLIILNSLGSLFCAMNKYEKSVQYFRRCLKIQRRIFGDNHPEYLQTLQNLIYIISLIDPARVEERLSQILADIQNQILESREKDKQKEMEKQNEKEMEKELMSTNKIKEEN